ncbi:MAG: hypothetical protein OHK0038_21660 [Flammeovirgaceae bacterium]
MIDIQFFKIKQVNKFNLLIINNLINNKIKFFIKILDYQKTMIYINAKFKSKEAF